MKGRVGEDGTVEIWIDGWHLSFPTDGDRPTAERGAAPADATDTVAEVTVDRSGSKPAVRVGDWIVWLDEPEPTAVRVKPDDGGGKVYWRYLRTDHTDRD